MVLTLRLMRKSNFVDSRVIFWRAYGISQITLGYRERNHFEIPRNNTYL